MFNRIENSATSFEPKPCGITQKADLQSRLENVSDGAGVRPPCVRVAQVCRATDNTIFYRSRPVTHHVNTTEVTNQLTYRTKVGSGRRHATLENRIVPLPPISAANNGTP